MPLHTRAARTREAVKEIILRRGLVTGDPLPTEAEFATELGLSRNSVREALQALQAVGIVDIRHGHGMFVGRMRLTGLVDELSFHGRLASPVQLIHHLGQIRETLEVGLVTRLVAAAPSPAGGPDPGGARPDLAAAAELLDKMDVEARTGPISADTDRRFHEALYQPLGNPLVGLLLGAFWDVYHQLSDAIGRPDESPAEVAARHRDIYRAILARDAEAAAAAVTAHFGGVWIRIGRL